MIGFDQPDQYSDEDELRRRYGLVGGGVNAPAVSIPTPAEVGRQNPAATLPVIQSAIPQVRSPQRATDEAELQRMESTGSGVQQVQQKHGILGGILRGLDIAGSVLAPGITAAIPGSTLHHDFGVTAQRGRVAQDVASEERQAQTGKTQAETDAIPQELDLKRKALNQKPTKDPNQLDLAHLYAQSLENGDETAAEKYRKAIISIQPEKAEKEPNRDDKAIAIMQKPANQRTPEEQSYLAAYHQYVKENKMDPGVARARIFVEGRPVQVAGEDPGEVVYKPAGEAMRGGMHAAGSGKVKAAQGVQKAFTSGQEGRTLNAFNTASEHLKLLSQLGDALQNGNTQLVNRIGNQIQTQFGYAAPTSFEMAKNAVAGEVAKTFKGQATNDEIHQIQSTISAAQSPEQLKGSIQTALALMASKKQALQQQYQQGLGAQPAFEHQAPTTQSDPLGIR